MCKPVELHFESFDLPPACNLSQFTCVMNGRRFAVNSDDVECWIAVFSVAFFVFDMLTLRQV